MLNELLVGLAAHCLVQGEHEVVVELLLGLLVKHVVALEQCLLRTKVVLAAIEAALSCSRC